MAFGALSWMIFIYFSDISVFFFVFFFPNLKTNAITEFCDFSV